MCTNEEQPPEADNKRGSNELAPPFRNGLASLRPLLASAIKRPVNGKNLPTKYPRIYTQALGTTRGASRLYYLTIPDEGLS
jgi:hypothetical protein